MSDTNQRVQSQKQARSLKFRIYEKEGLYHPCSEKKDADQLRGYHEAGLCLCFHIIFMHIVVGFFMVTVSDNNLTLSL